MALTKAKKTGLLACVVVFAVVFMIPLSAQHVTLEDSIKSGGVPSILRTLSDPKMAPSDPAFFDLRVNLIKALGTSANQGNKEVFNQLVSCMGEGTTRVAHFNNMPMDYWKVRAEAAMALGRLGNKDATPHLVNTYLDDADLHVRVCAVRAIGLLQDRNAVPRLLDFLSKTTTDMIAMELVVALERIGDKRAFPMLLAVSQRNFSQGVKNRALSALKNLKY